MLQNETKKIWQDREVRSFGALLVVIALWLGVTEFLDPSSLFANLNNRLLVTFGFVSVWGLWTFWQLRRPARHHLNLSSSDGVDDAVALACQQVRHNVAEAIDFLKEKLSKNFGGLGRFRAFQQMPWYLVIGAQGAGKTQLIAKSGLGFLETERFVQLTPKGMQTNGTTNWWFAPGALMIDVPGHYLQQSLTLTPARAAWFELLKQIRRYRARRAIHGVIVAIDVEKILQLSPDNENALLPLLRSRLQEIAYRLKQNFPVYIICTQADKIQGFAEYFDDLGPQERQQNLGLTFPFRPKLSQADLFADTFDKFLINLHQRVLWRLHHERDRAKRYLIQHFPHQMSYLKENLQRLVYDLSAQGSPIALRGIYFTSAESHAEPHESVIDQIGDTLSRQFDLLPKRHTQAAPARAQKAFFVRQLFDGQIFREASLASQHLSAASASRQENFWRFGVLGLGVIIILSALITWAERYQTQTQRLDTANMALSDYKLLALNYAHVATDSQFGVGAALQKILPALNALRLARDNAQKADLPWLLRFQLHHEAPLGVMTQKLYDHDLATKFIPGVRALLQQQLTLPASDPLELYKTFKVYLMLGDPLHFDQHYLHAYFHQEWQNPLTRNAVFMQHLDSAIKHHAILPAVSDKQIVEQTRTALNALPYAILAQAILQSDLTGINHSAVFNLPNAQSASKIFLLPKETISAVFTLAGLNAVDEKINAAALAAVNGNWILGNKSEANADVIALRASLINQFAEDYANAWQTWLANIRVQHFASLDDLDKSLQNLTSQNSSLTALLEATAENTHVTGAPITDPVLQAGLQNHLAPGFTALNAIFSHNNSVMQKNLESTLSAASSEIHQVVTAKDPGFAAFQIVRETATHGSDHQDALMQLLLLARQMPAPLGNWLTQIAEQGQQLIMQEARMYISTRWQQTVLSFYELNLAGRFPLDPRAEESVSLENFSAFFKPNGMLDQFVSQYLLPFIDTHQARWQWKIVNGQSVFGNNALLVQLERANIIQKLYFNIHTGKLENQFDFKITSVSPAISEIALQDNNNKNTVNLINQSALKLQWPDQTGNNMQFLLTNKEGNQFALSADGEWALFKLLAAAKLLDVRNTNGDQQQFDYAWDVNNLHFTARIIAPAELNPFVPGIVSAFKLTTF